MKYGAFIFDLDSAVMPGVHDALPLDRVVQAVANAKEHEIVAELAWKRLMPTLREEFQDV